MLIARRKISRGELAERGDRGTATVGVEEANDRSGLHKREDLGELSKDR